MGILFAFFYFRMRSGRSLLLFTGNAIGWYWLVDQIYLFSGYAWLAMQAEDTHAERVNTATVPAASAFTGENTPAGSVALSRLPATCRRHACGKFFSDLDALLALRKKE